MFLTMKQQGFTLVEILVTLVIVSVGMLALGSFYTSMISQESIAQERITAVHMAEQLIEDWELNNLIPTPNCQVAGTVPTLALGVTTTGCKALATTGIPITYEILLIERPALAPLPVTHPNNPSVTTTDASGLGMYTMLQTIDPYGNIIGGSPPVMVRSVQVSWIHGTQHKVYLTHITRYIP